VLGFSNRFSIDNFKVFRLSFQSSLHLSLTVLVRYRFPTVYLVLGGVYLPIKAALSSSPNLGTPALCGDFRSTLSFPSRGLPYDFFWFLGYIYGDVTLSVAPFQVNLGQLDRAGPRAAPSQATTPGVHVFTCVDGNRPSRGLAGAGGRHRFSGLDFSLFTRRY